MIAWYPVDNKGQDERKTWISASRGVSYFSSALFHCLNKSVTSMAKKRELSIGERKSICVLRDEGLSMAAIAKKIGCSKSTVKFTLDRVMATESCASRRRTGRPSLISKKEARYITLAARRDRRSNVHMLASQLNSARLAPVSSTTIRRVLLKWGFHGRVAVRKPLLRRQNIRKRYQWALKHKKWTVHKWRKVFWTDESKFDLFGTNRRIYVRRRVGERYIRDCLVPTVKHGGGNVMVWGAISGYGVGPLKLIEGIMDKKVYHQILIKHAIPAGRKLLGDGFTFMEDNDPKHSSILCRNYLNNKEKAGN